MTAREFEEQGCINCSILFWVPKGFTDNRRKDKRDFYCPNGHAMAFTENEADRLRRERDRLKQNEAYLQDRLKREQTSREAAERSASAMRGQVTKLKNRAANGVCPCCNRTFSDLQRHMASKHKGFVAEPLADGVRTVQ